MKSFIDANLYIDRDCDFALALQNREESVTRKNETIFYHREELVTGTRNDHNAFFTYNKTIYVGIKLKIARFISGIE